MKTRVPEKEVGPFLKVDTALPLLKIDAFPSAGTTFCTACPEATGLLKVLSELRGTRAALRRTTIHTPAFDASLLELDSTEVPEPFRLLPLNVVLRRRNTRDSASCSNQSNAASMR